MIDEQKILGLLQAKALGCLDPSDENLLSEFINAGHLFPWDELGALQSVASLLPISLPLELPDPLLKDKIALRLIKLTEEIRAQKIIEEEKQKQQETEPVLPQEPEFAEEEFEQVVEENKEPEETTQESQSEEETIIEVKTEIPDIVEENDFNMDVDEATFNLDNVVLPDYESISAPETGFDQIEKPEVENLTEKPFEEPSIDTPPIDIVETFSEPPVEEHLTDTVETVEEQLTETPPIDVAAPIEEPPTETVSVNFADSTEQPSIETSAFDSVEGFEEVQPQLFDIVEKQEEPITEPTPEETYTEPIESSLTDKTITEPIEKVKEDVPEQLQTKSMQESKVTPETDFEKLPDLTKRSVADKMFKAIEKDFDSLKYHYERSEAKLKRGLMVTYIIIAVLFLLLIFSFLKLSSDVNTLLDEIKSLKKNSTSSLVGEKSINSFYRFFC